MILKRLISHRRHTNLNQETLNGSDRLRSSGMGKGVVIDCKVIIARRTSMMMALCGILLILYKTLYPFVFCFRETYSNIGYHFLLLGWGKSGIMDVQGNILLFLPLGFGLAGYLMQTVRLALLASLVLAILVSFGLSYTVEVLQIFLPSRFPSLIDVFSNSVGGLLGFLCFRLWECKVKVIDNTSAFVQRNLLISFLGYAALAFLISISLQWYTSLSTWDKTFPILLGNEKTGDRPWQGCISELYIADRAISKAEVANVFSKKESITSIGDSLLASYQLKGLGNYQNKMGNLPDLVWKGELQDVQQGEGVFPGPNHWLETAAPAEYLTQRIVKTSQFTLGLTAATGDTTQTGPARIISLSGDPSHCNFTLGQEGCDLIFRLQIPITNLKLIVPDLFSTTNPHNLIITYDGSVLLLYVDKVLNSYKLEVSPGGISFDYIFHLNMLNLVFYKILYYAIIFVPLGVLLSFTVKKTGGQFVIKMLIICGGILLSSFIMEGILMSVRGRELRLENLLISMIFTAGPMVFLRYLKPCLHEKRKI